MRESFWGYWIIILGVFVIVIMMLVSNVTSTNTQDYYLIKEVAEQSMVDAVDLGYYRASGELRINAEKFVESFLRRFSENVALNTYQIGFYGIYEAPPKVSIKVTTKSSSYNIGASSDSFDIVNKVDAILELDGTGVGGGAQSATIGNSATSDTNSTSDFTLDGRFNPTVSMIHDIYKKHPQEFYNMSGDTGTKKDKNEFAQIAHKYLEERKGSSLTTEELTIADSSINQYFNSLPFDYVDYSDIDFDYNDYDFDFDDTDFDYDDGDDDEESDFEPTLRMMQSIFRTNKEDFYYVDWEAVDSEEYSGRNKYTLMDYDTFLEEALNHFYYEKNDDLNKFETAQVEDIVSTFYSTCPKQYYGKLE